PRGRFSTYLFQIGRHYWLNQRKKERRAPQSVPWQEQATVEAGFIPSPPQALDPERAVLDGHRRRAILRAVAELPPAYREVFDMGHLRGLAYRAIARELGIPEGTVKSRMFEAVRRLRRALNSDDVT